MVFDLLIRGGTLVDGTGGPARPADVGVTGDRIDAVGDLGGERARRVIDATDRIVTPGFVDLHTHLDAQVGWDPLLTSSCWHGVTTVVMGNCGVTFAPVRPHHHDLLAEMMESVEDIPAAAIRDGLPWTWVTYGEYLAALDRLPKAVNVGGMVGHCALRTWAMGERAADAEAVPSAAELAEMRALVDEAIGAGALGFSTSRTLRHTVPDGRHVPGTFATTDELLALTGPLGDRDAGIVGCSPRFDGEGPAEPRVATELAWMRAVASATGRPVTFNLSQTAQQGSHYRLAMRLAAEARAAGAHIRPQTTSKSVGLLFSLATFTPFDRHPPWRALRDLPLRERLEVLAAPGRRAELVDVARHDDASRCFVVDGEPLRLDNPPERSLAALADRAGTSPVELFIDLCLRTDGRVVLVWPLLNQDQDAIAEMLTDPGTLLGLADAGAHVGQIIDASQPTYFLTHWVRDRGLIPLPDAIRRLSAEPAAFVGLGDRGVVAAGRRADLNVLDWDRLALCMPAFTFDLPHGAGRWTQRARGYVATVVGGVVTFEDGEHTGAHPGTVARPSAA